MKTLSFLRICFIIGVNLLASITYAQEGCKLKKDSDGIKVYSCTTEESQFKEVRASFVLESNIEDYLYLVRDVDNYKNWHYKSSNARILKKINPFELIYYTQIAAPWPVSNRDMVLRLQLKLNPKDQSLTVILTSIPDYIPEDEDFVRVPYSNSEMIMTPIGKNKLSVEYKILADPGGQLPAWVVNLVSAQGPYETFKNLKDTLEKKSNANQKMPNKSSSEAFNKEK